MENFTSIQLPVSEKTDERMDELTDQNTIYPATKLAEPTSIIASSYLIISPHFKITC